MCTLSATSAVIGGVIFYVLDLYIIHGVGLGFLYGMTSYSSWVILLNQCGSISYEDDEEPETLDLISAIICFMLPIFEVLLLILALCIIAGWLVLSVIRLCGFILRAT